MKERHSGGKLLKSAIAVVLVAAMMVLTLPGFKMEADANTGQVVNPTYVASDGACLWDANNSKVNDSVTIKAGESIFVGAADSVVLSGLDGISNVIRDATHMTSIIGGGTFPEQGVLYTLTKDVTFKTNSSSNTISFTVASSDNSSSGATGGSIDPAAFAQTVADYQAYVKAQKELVAALMENARINKEKQAQAERDAEYFRNINEANAKGDNMLVLSDHSAVKSTIKGTYWADSLPGFAASALDPLNESNLLIETWTINSANSPDAFKSIKGAASDLNGTLVGALQVNIGEKGSDGKPNYDNASDTPVANVKFGVPRDGASYAMVKVVSTGKITVLNNLTIEDGFTTLALPIGEAAYGLVRLP